MDLSVLVRSKSTRHTTSFVPIRIFVFPYSVCHRILNLFQGVKRKGEERNGCTRNSRIKVVHNMWLLEEVLGMVCEMTILVLKFVERGSLPRIRSYRRGQMKGENSFQLLSSTKKLIIYKNKRTFYIKFIVEWLNSMEFGIIHIHSIFICDIQIVENSDRDWNSKWSAYHQPTCLPTVGYHLFTYHLITLPLAARSYLCVRLGGRESLEIQSSNEVNSKRS